MNATIYILDPAKPDDEARLCRDFLLWQGKQSTFTKHTTLSFQNAQGSHRPVIADVAHSFHLRGFQELLAHWDRFALWNV